MAVLLAVLTLAAVGLTVAVLRMDAPRPPSVGPVGPHEDGPSAFPLVR